MVFARTGFSTSILAYFMTHCRWNSSIEVIANGVHIIAFPQLGDQVTDVKYLVDEFRTGVRLSRGVTENRIIPRCEVEQSLHEVMSGPKAAEMKENVLKWKKKASEAVTEGGSSDQNLQSFINKLMTLQSSNQKLAKLSTSIQLVVTTRPGVPNIQKYMTLVCEISNNIKINIYLENGTRPPVGP
ncbi:cinnamate beta-D-glucosyltransferase-like [Capsicum annuum]|uniref:cinnamate beta-D-glucosyltransferase-like n=1 Tax=Capsicum annuum TaxID=4072 RepID=UPI001FB0D39C|nr:cinnamate beta-D-glucosyltransferase-like [Capsicum annuum]